MRFRKYILRRLEEFRKLGENGETIFDFHPFLNLKLRATVMSELAFCISTANSSAIAGLRFQKLFEEGVNYDDALKKAGVRFYNRKAEYVREALKNPERIFEALQMDSFKARKKLVKVRGLGYKEASHFLRNTGREDIAIIDRHILRWLVENGYLSEIPVMNPKRYIEIEKILSEIADERNTSLAELDLMLWAQKTGKVLK